MSGITRNLGESPQSTPSPSTTTAANTANGKHNAAQISGTEKARAIKWAKTIQGIDLDTQAREEARTPGTHLPPEFRKLLDERGMLDNGPIAQDDNYAAKLENLCKIMIWFNKAKEGLSEQNKQSGNNTQNIDTQTTDHFKKCFEESDKKEAEAFRERVKKEATTPGTHLPQELRNLLSGRKDSSGEPMLADKILHEGKQFDKLSKIMDYFEELKSQELTKLQKANGVAQSPEALNEAAKEHAKTSALKFYNDFFEKSDKEQEESRRKAEEKSKIQADEEKAQKEQQKEQMDKKGKDAMTASKGVAEIRDIATAPFDVATSFANFLNESSMSGARDEFILLVKLFEGLAFVAKLPFNLLQQKLESVAKQNASPEAYKEHTKYLKDTEKSRKSAYDNPTLSNEAEAIRLQTEAHRGMNNANFGLLQDASAQAQKELRNENNMKSPDNCGCPER